MKDYMGQKHRFVTLGSLAEGQADLLMLQSEAAANSGPLRLDWMVE